MRATLSHPPHRVWATCQTRFTASPHANPSAATLAEKLSRARRASTSPRPVWVPSQPAVPSCHTIGQRSLYPQLLVLRCLTPRDLVRSSIPVHALAPTSISIEGERGGAHGVADAGDAHQRSLHIVNLHVEQAPMAIFGDDASRLPPRFGIKIRLATTWPPVLPLGGASLLLAESARTQHSQMLPSPL